MSNRILLLFVIFVQFGAATSFSLEQKKRPGRQIPDLCQPKLLNCNPENDSKPEFIWHRYESRFIKLEVAPTCKLNKVIIEWIVYEGLVDRGFRMNQYTNRTYAVIDPYALSVGKGAMIQLDLSHFNPKTQKLTSGEEVECYFDIVPGYPVANIFGGNQRTLPPDIDFTAIGGLSMDVDEALTNKEVGRPSIYLNYQWSCLNKPFCSGGSGTGPNLFIDKQYMTANSKIDLSLVVSTETRSDSMNQSITVKAGVPGLEIRCLKNCYPVSNFRMHTPFRVICISNCPPPNNISYTWTMNPADKIDLSFLGQTRLQVSTFEHRISDKWSVSVATKEGGFGLVELKHQKVVRCETFETEFSKANKGLARKTVKWEGQSIENKRLYLYQKSEDVEQDGILIAQSPMDARFEDILFAPGFVDITLRIVDDIYCYEICAGQVTVPSYITDNAATIKDKISKIIEVYRGPQDDSVSSAKNVVNMEKVIQLLSIVIQEAKHIRSEDPSYKKFINDLTLSVYEDLMLFPLVTLSEIASVTGILEHLVGLRAGGDRDAIIGRRGTALCRYISRKLYQLIKMDPLREHLSEFVERYSLSLLRASMMDFQPNPSLIMSPVEKEDVNYPGSDIQLGITENYPLYEGPNSEREPIIQCYEELAVNAIEANAYLGYAMAGTMVPGEPSRILQESKLNWVMVMVSREAATHITTMQLKSVQIIPSTDFLSFKNNIFRIVAWRSNPFWFNKDEIYTEIIDIKFYFDSEPELFTYFQNPMHISFQHVQPYKLKEFKTSVHVPENPHEWTDDTISVLRVDLRKMRELCLQFLNMPQGVELWMVATGVRRPQLKDFKKPVIINSDSNTVNLNVALEFDSKQYFGILPPRNKENQIVDLEYTIGFAEISCIHYNVAGRMWDANVCKAGPYSSLKTINCLCYHASPYSGTFYSPRVTEEKSVDFEFGLVLQLTWVVLYFVLAVYLIYFIAVNWWVPLSKLTYIYAIFVADNLRTDRYGYLIIVRTGSMHGAGTTSNVVIKLIGSKHASQPHILNFPDPERIWLQRSAEDRFVLAEGKHLGEIVEVQLWLDFVGHNPAWFCEEVCVYDLQDENFHWYFPVNQWFTPMVDEQSEIVMQPNVGDASSGPPEERRISHTWNLDTGAENNNFTYIKKITVLLSIILCTNAVALVLYDVPRGAFSDAFSFHGHYALYWEVFSVAIISALLTFAVHVILVALLRHSSVQFPTKKVKLEKRWTTFAWILCIILILSSTTILIFYGFAIGYISALLCITSTIMALLISIILLENLYIVLVKCLGSKRTKTAGGLGHFTLRKAIVQAEMQRKVLVEKFGDEILRPLLRNMYTRLDVKDIKIIRMVLLARQLYWNVLQDLLMFSLFVVLLYTLIMINRDPFIVHNHNIVRDIFVTSAYTKTIQFEQIHNLDNFWKYMNETLIPSLQTSFWYGKWKASDPGLIGDYNTKILGVAQLRQHKIRRNYNCNMWATDLLHMDCYPEFSSSTASFANYAPLWLPKTIELSSDRYYGFWKYRIDAGYTVGELATYPDGGYIAYLGRNLFNSYFNLLYLKDFRWFDTKTKCIFIEFLVYNANYNVFDSVSLLLEKTSAGTLIHSHKIVTARLIQSEKNIASFAVMTLICFLVVLLFLIVKLFTGFVKNLKKFFKDFWNILDLFIILMSFTCIVLLHYRNSLVQQLMYQLREFKHNKFISYDNLFNLETVITTITGVLICTATLRLWKLLRIGMMFQVMEKTLIYSAPALGSLFLLQLLLMYAFSLAATLLFGYVSKDFCSISKCIRTLFLLSLNLYEEFDFDALTRASGGIAYVCYAFFMIVTFIFYNIYITLIIISYEKSRAFYSERRGYTLERFLKEETLYFCEIFKIRTAWWRLRGGASAADPEFKAAVYPKADEHRYTDCSKLTKRDTRSMLWATCAVLDNLEHKDPNYKLMASLIYSVLKEEDDEGDLEQQVFYRDPLKPGHFVKDSAMLRMEHITKFLYSKPKVEGEEPVDEMSAALTNVEDTLEYVESVVENIRTKDLV